MVTGPGRGREVVGVDGEVVQDDPDEEEKVRWWTGLVGVDLGKRTRERVAIMLR